MKTAPTYAIMPAAPADIVAVAELLRKSDLPSEDFAPHLANFLVVRVEDRIVGAIGAELHGAHGLLRSFVIEPEFRGTGLGSRLLEELARVAASWNISHWWLLTTTAEKFFARRGFKVVDRSAVPASIAGTREFEELCPSTAVCMTRARALI